MEMATTKFRKLSSGEYEVTCNCFGSMRVIGRVVKSDRPMFATDRWWAYRPSGKTAGHAGTRSDAVGILAR